MNDDWQLYFAVDTEMVSIWSQKQPRVGNSSKISVEEKEIRLYEFGQIGSPKQLSEIYRLVAALRAIRQWAEETWAPWWRKTVLWTA
jgi:hypothetical protein